MLNIKYQHSNVTAVLQKKTKIFCWAFSFASTTDIHRNFNFLTHLLRSRWKDLLLYYVLTYSTKLPHTNPVLKLYVLRTNYRMKVLYWEIPENVVPYLTFAEWEGFFSLFENVSYSSRSKETLRHVAIINKNLSGRK